MTRQEKETKISENAHLLEKNVQKSTVEESVVQSMGQIVSDEEKPVAFATGQAFAALGDSGLKLESAAGEIIDNSIEAQATRIELLLKYAANSNRSNAVKYITEMTVIDNGCGMDYQTIKNCLVLGASLRTQVRGKSGIGRYGMGLPSAATSLAWRVEVYSRTVADEDFMYVYLDFQDRDNNDIYLPLPQKVSPADPSIEEYANLLNGESGTIIVLKKFKSKQEDSQLAYYIGRTYRKFIAQGVDIRINSSCVYLHDPLFLCGPTRFDAEAEANGNLPDLKGTPHGSGRTLKIPVEIPGRPGETADVEILMSILPKEWYTDGKQPGSKTIYKNRKIHLNEGVSILRCGREVYDGALSGVIGRTDESKPREEEIDRWWGCEISFPAELDARFEMRFIKNDIVPDADLRQKIRDTIKDDLRRMREKIQSDRAAWRRGQQEEKEREDSDPIKDAELIYKDVVKRDKKHKPGVPKSKDDEKKKDDTIETILKKRLDPEKYEDAEKRAKKKAELSSLPLVVNPNSHFYTSALFYPEYQLDQIVLNLNVKHPFYVDVLEPLLGSFAFLDSAEENASHIVNELVINRSEVKNAIFLLLFSLADGEKKGLFGLSEDEREEEEEKFRNFRETWGQALAAAVREVRKKKKE